MQSKEGRNKEFELTFTAGTYFYVKTFPTECKSDTSNKVTFTTETKEITKPGFATTSRLINEQNFLVRILRKEKQFSRKGDRKITIDYLKRNLITLSEDIQHLIKKWSRTILKTRHGILSVFRNGRSFPIGRNGKAVRQS